MEKIILSIIFIFFAICQSFAQSKKAQIESLIFSLDSCKQLLEIERALSKKLENQISLLTEKNQLKEDELVKSNNSLVNSYKKTEELTNKLSLSNDSLKIYRNTINKLTITRDFSNEIFTESELDYIINYLKKELKQFNEEEEELVSKVLIDSKKIIVHLEGELGSVPAFDFSINYNKLLAGDLDNDGTQEILFNVGVTGGGTAYWGQLYCLKIFPNNCYLIFEIEVPCGCTGEYECTEPNTEILNISDNILTIENQCFLDSDPLCCPSLVIKPKYEFSNNSLILVK
jgi:hypothetical protein